MKAKRFEIGKTYIGTGEVKGIDFTLLHRYDDLCVFKRSDGYYEVITVKWRDLSERYIDGRKIVTGDAEYYPSGESWIGKCVPTLSRALEIYDRMRLQAHE